MIALLNIFKRSGQNTAFLQNWLFVPLILTDVYQYHYCKWSFSAQLYALSLNKVLPLHRVFYVRPFPWKVYDALCINKYVLWRIKNKAVQMSLTDLTWNTMNDLWSIMCCLNVTGAQEIIQYRATTTFTVKVQ